MALRTNKSIIKLVDDAGASTVAGRYWAKQTGSELPAGGFMNQVAERTGNVESIRLRDGARGVTRRWDEATGEYSFTRLGNQYYKTLRRSYVAVIPVNIEGRRKDGSTYNIKSTMPVSKLGLLPTTIPLNMTSPRRRERVRELVTRDLPAVLYEYSEEVWTLDPRGAWQIHEETVGIFPGLDEAAAITILDRPTGAHPIFAQFLFPDAICPEAYEEHEDKMCCPRQMALVLRVDCGAVCSDLTGIERQLYQTETWMEKGATSRMVLEYCRMHGLGCAIVHNEAVLETLPGKPVLAFTVHGGHSYFYGNQHVAKLLQKRRTTAVIRLKKEQRASTTPIAAEWLQWGRKLVPGHYSFPEDSMAQERAWFLQQGKHPKVLLKSETCPRALLYNCTARLKEEPGVVHLHALPEHWETIAAWVVRLDCGLDYRGEGLPNMALKVLHRLVKRGKEREWLTGEQKAALLEEFDHKCALCGARGLLEFDHIARHSEGYGEQLMQPLCGACHRLKTDGEAKSYDEDHLASHFEKTVWEQYVDSPRPPPLVHRARAVPDTLVGLQIVDVVRCRKRALEFNVHPLPVFSPLDSIVERTTPVLGDLNFVTKKYKNCVVQLGYCGPGWQHRVQTEFLLYMGVISWDDISHLLTATAHLPAGLLTKPLRQMEAAWGRNDTLAKLAVNSLIGLWAIDACFSHTLRSSTYETDAPAGALKQTFHYEGGQIYDFISSTRLLGGSSCRVLHDLCMCTEHTRVGEALFELKQSRAIVYELKTDSVLYKPLKRTRPRLDSLTFRDLDTLRDLHEPAPKMRRLDQYCLMSAIHSDDTPYRVQAAVEKDPLKCNPGLPKRTWDLAPNPRVWQHLQQEEGERRVMEGSSLLVLGIAGTGKTFFIQGVTERLRGQGKVVDIISKTHVASRRAGGVTADHWVRRYVMAGCPRCDCLWVDEVSQLDIGLWLQISKLTFTGMQFLLSRDFNQFAPLGNTFRGAQVAETAFEESGLLHTLSSGNVVTLTTCMRSDSELFSFYSSLIKGGSRFEIPLAEAVRQAKAQFRATNARWNLVISHQRRIRINRGLNQSEAPADAVLMEVTGKATHTNSAQTMLVWPSLVLVGCVSAEKKGIRNGCLYTVASVADGVVRLEGLEASFTYEQCVQWLRLSYAQTYASC